MSRGGAKKQRTVRRARDRSKLIDLVYPGLAKKRRAVVAEINQPEYTGVVLGLEYGSIVAWVYERDTVGS